VFKSAVKGAQAATWLNTTVDASTARHDCQESIVSCK